MRKGFPRARIDPRVQVLVKDLSQKEYEEMNRRFKAEQRPGPISTWNGILIRGFDDYRLCNYYQVPYYLERLTFVNQEEALAWVCEQQLLRDDLSVIWRKFLIGAQSLYTSRSLTSQNLASGFQEIAVDIAERNHISLRTIYVYRSFANALLEIEEKVPQMFHFILSGKRRLSMEEIKTLSKMERDGLFVITQRLEAGEHVLIPPRRKHGRRQSPPTSNSLGAPTSSVSSKKEEPKTSRMETTVKKMPSYNPDAVLNQLALTIPTWVQSIQRAIEKTDIQAVSTAARDSLWRELESMRETVLFTQAWIGKEKK